MPPSKLSAKNLSDQTTLKILDFLTKEFESEQQSIRNVARLRYDYIRFYWVIITGIALVIYYFQISKAGQQTNSDHFLKILASAVLLPGYLLYFLILKIQMSICLSEQWIARIRKYFVRTDPTNTLAKILNPFVPKHWYTTGGVFFISSALAILNSYLSAWILYGSIEDLKISFLLIPIKLWQPFLLTFVAHILTWYFVLRQTYYNQEEEAEII